MAATPAQLSALIRKRRAVYPAAYVTRPIDEAIIRDILENAAWAPTHRRTEPWRFQVFLGEGLEKLARYMGEHYLANTPAEQFSGARLDKVRQNPLKAACVIAICMQRDPQERIPEWEEVAAVSCAVQNMWLTCTAYGIGAYWSTPKAALEAGGFLGLGPGESCLGLFYMGYHQDDLPEGTRQDVQRKTTWITDGRSA
ncbi:MAG: hypothetical protein RLY31_2205 [Bacteroidota bacterium]|jgi:nitroreductase